MHALSNIGLLVLALGYMLHVLKPHTCSVKGLHVACGLSQHTRLGFGPDVFLVLCGSLLVLL